METVGQKAWGFSSEPTACERLIPHPPWLEDKSTSSPTVIPQDMFNYSPHRIQHIVPHTHTHTHTHIRAQTPRMSQSEHWGIINTPLQQMQTVFNWWLMSDAHDGNGFITKQARRSVLWVYSYRERHLDPSLIPPINTLIYLNYPRERSLCGWAVYSHFSSPHSVIFKHALQLNIYTFHTLFLPTRINQFAFISLS